MKRRLSNIILKNIKDICVFVPKDIRLSFYIAPMGDVGVRQDFTNHDLSTITELRSNTEVNPDLFVKGATADDQTIYRLLDEGVLKNHLTGADLGIYNYKSINQDNKVFDYSKYVSSDYVQSFDDLNQDIEEEDFFATDDEFDSRYCLLAEEDPLLGEHSKVVKTFKGYLDVTTSEFSVLRKCNCDNDDILEVYIPQEYISKYQLRNGDEIMGTCKQQGDQMVLNALFTINQQSRLKWDTERPWFNTLKNSVSSKLSGGKDYIQSIIDKFELFCGDNALFYLNKTSQKGKVLSRLIVDLGDMFDKVVYINSHLKSSVQVEDCYNLVKFCALLSDDWRYQATVVLLGINYAKRMIELGEKVAIIIDDIKGISDLDGHYDDELPISKTIFSCIKASTLGSATSFTMVPLHNVETEHYDVNSIFKLAESLGICIDNNEIDLFNSYRV